MDQKIGAGRFLREPFRIFFVIGLMAGLTGVGIWHLYFVGSLEHFSGTMHARFQIQGFLGSFIVGFLMTAIPRLMGTRPCSKWELGLFLVLFWVNLVAQLVQNPLGGDLAFLAILLLLIFFAVRRFPSRDGFPPPYFVLVPMGIFNALFGLFLIIPTEIFGGDRDLLAAGEGMLNQGFVLCLVLGIGSLLGPRILGFTTQEISWSKSRNPSPEWGLKALPYLAAGGMIFMSFFIEMKWPPIGQGLRALAASMIILGRMRLHEAPSRPGFLPQAVRGAFLFILVGLWALPFFSAHRVAILHIVFIGGFSLLTLAVGIRVVFGHSGFGHLLKKRLVFVGLLLLLFVAAIFFRIGAEYHQEEFFFWLNLASLLWLTGALLWAFMIFPKLFFPRPESAEEE